MADSNKVMHINDSRAALERLVEGWECDQVASGNQCVPLATALEKLAITDALFPDIAQDMGYTPEDIRAIADDSDEQSHWRELFNLDEEDDADIHFHTRAHPETGDVMTVTCISLRYFSAVLSVYSKVKEATDHGRALNEWARAMETTGHYDLQNNHESPPGKEIQALEQRELIRGLLNNEAE